MSVHKVGCRSVNTGCEGDCDCMGHPLCGVCIARDLAAARAALPIGDGWHAREEFLTTFREAYYALHRLWTAAVGTPGYDKAEWKLIDNALARFARDAAEKVGIGRSEPLR